jgi:hypothetical protein
MRKPKLDADTLRYVRHLVTRDTSTVALFAGREWQPVVTRLLDSLIGETADQPAATETGVGGPHRWLGRELVEQLDLPHSATEIETRTCSIPDCTYMLGHGGKHSSECTCAPYHTAVCPARAACAHIIDKQGYCARCGIRPAETAPRDAPRTGPMARDGFPDCGCEAVCDACKGVPQKQVSEFTDTESDVCEVCRAVVTEEDTCGSYACVSCGHIVCGECLWTGAARTRPTCKACVPADSR